MRLFKDRVWVELHKKLYEELIDKTWTARGDYDIFNSFPFKLICAKVEELEDRVKELELSIKSTNEVGAKNE